MRGRSIELLELVVVLLVAGGCALLFSEQTVILPVIMVTLILGALFGLAKEFWVPALILSIPLEISRLVISESQETLSPNRLFLGYLFIVWLITCFFFKRRVRLPDDRWFRFLLLFLGWEVLTLVYTPDMGSGVRRLLLQGVSMTAAVLLYNVIDSKQKLARSVWFYLVVASILAVVGIAQYFSGQLFWNEELANFAVRGDTGTVARVNRVNATFHDPNIFGRFLAVGLCLAYAYLQQTRQRWLCGLGIVLMGLALLFTYSRVNLLSMLLFGLMVGVYSRNRRMVLLLVLGLTMVFAGLVVVLPEFFLRLVEARDLFDQETSVRIYLSIAGLKMFLSNPLFGIGTGGFESTVVTQYFKLLPTRGSISKSHVELVTILAETGLVGLVLVSGVFYGIYRRLRPFLRSIDVEAKTYALATLGAVLVIFLSANSSGKLFRDPMLGLIFGMILLLPRLYPEVGRPPKP